ncbi:MAG: methyltransferase [Chitinivibrionales bacterium]|nr:methyltransferase [Chitinivibrionales bacterium]
MQTLRLKPKKQASLNRKHPWIFSGALQAHDPVEDGETVEVLDSNGTFRAIGHFHNGSIAVRVISFVKLSIDQKFWNEKIAACVSLRRSLKLPNDSTNCYRLVHGEADGLPGLIIDVYASTAVIQAHSIGMHRNLRPIVDALNRVMHESVSAIYDKSKDALPPEFARTVENGRVYGKLMDDVIRENELEFGIDFAYGQKTGFFLDQRENRRLLREYARDKSVLNCYAYTGGFTLSALRADAREVVSVDSSAAALRQAEDNVDKNFPHETRHTSQKSDVLHYLKSCDRKWDIIILDPPAFAKHRSSLHKAVQGYKRINLAALHRLASPGILFTFSCSQAVSDQLFADTLVAAGIESQHTIRILHKLTQPADHPIGLFHPEGSYLKGLVLYVD